MTSVVTPRTRGLRAAVAAILMVVALAGCSTIGRLPAVPANLTAQAQPQGQATGAHMRFLVARDVSGFTEEALLSLERERAWRASHGEMGALPPTSFLAVSGGGDNGAFGAGLLTGWTASGQRPQFRAVTGVSTGALTAPFAFLGPAYDGALTQVYTGVGPHDIFKSRDLISGFFGDSMADTAPLYGLVERYVDRNMLDAIAAEYQKGRLLLVGTTNLDTLEPVIWNMTAIAASRDPEALTLFRKILLASAAIPGLFPPVMIDVTVEGRHYQEMHVDGGAMAQVFIYPPAVNLAEKGEPGRQRTLYIIRNARLDADWASVRRRTLPIAIRAIDALMQTQGIGDLYRIYATTQRDGVDYNLAYIPRTFEAPHPAQFDPAYMRALYDTGYDLGRGGYRWQKEPPGYSAPKGASK